jgi:hypothetical protein
MGLEYNTYLTSNRIYGCKTCKAHLANHEDIISRVGRILRYLSLCLYIKCSVEITSLHFFFNAQEELSLAFRSMLTGRRRTFVGSTAKPTSSTMLSTLNVVSQASAV